MRAVEESTQRTLAESGHARLTGADDEARRSELRVARRANDQARRVRVDDQLRGGIAQQLEIEFRRAGTAGAAVDHFAADRMPLRDFLRHVDAEILQLSVRTGGSKQAERDDDQSFHDFLLLVVTEEGKSLRPLGCEIG